MTTQQAANQAELISFFTHDDAESEGPYGPGETARATAAANAALSLCWMCQAFGPEHDCPCDTPTD